MVAHIATWSIAALAAIAILIRPWQWSEAVWAAAGATLLVASSLLPWRDALAAVAQGTNLYLFLIGMMLLAELARLQGLFDWLAALAVRRARGSPRRLFGLVYLVGILVTVLLSNDATAVVLTPAVYAAARSARAEPLPYVLVCAFIANAASFVLPISNPANLVVFNGHVPPLAQWLGRFLLPATASIIATFLALRFSQRHALNGVIATDIALPPLGPGGRLTALGIVLTALALLGANAAGARLGVVTLAAALVTTAAALLRARESPWPLVRAVHWAILPLIGGLFVLVEGLQRTGALRWCSVALSAYAHHAGIRAAWYAGSLIALSTNALNNLPMALVARYAAADAPGQTALHDALLIGVDLGPNLAVTGSLATILWLSTLRREGQYVSAAAFLRLGLLVMPPALLLALASALLL